MLRIAAPALAPLAFVLAGPTGCGTDVLLGGSADAVAVAPDAGPSGDAGTAPPDAPATDAPGTTPFPDGAWSLAISATSTEVLCTGSLAGREPDFAAVTRDALGLEGGPLDLAGLDAARLLASGPPIAAGYRVATLTLERAAGGAPGVPEDVWMGIATRAEPGPAGTEMIALALEAFELTLTPAAFDGRASALFVDLGSEDAQCTVGFAARFTR